MIGPGFSPGFFIISIYPKLGIFQAFIYLMLGIFNYLCEKRYFLFAFMNTFILYLYQQRNKVLNNQIY